MQPIRKPEWLRAKADLGPEGAQVRRMLRARALHTVCEEAHCPNRAECFGRRTATFLILGDRCTRNCTFCTVDKGLPCPPDPDEPARVAAAVAELALRHVVVTSVTRDDLPDGGAGLFAAVIRAIRAGLSDPPVIEVLIPDFQGDEAALLTVLDARPDILNHNVETVPRLYPEVRPEADYRRSLTLLAHAKKEAPLRHTKSGVMVGLGETHDEVLRTFRDLRDAGCDILTVGQYLAPSKNHHPVAAYVTPDEFAQYKREAEDMGFALVASGPLVRSSYMAEALFGRMQKG